MSAGTELTYLRQVCTWSSGCKYPLSSMLPAPLQKAGTRIGDACIRVEGIGTWMLAFCVGYRTSAELGNPQPPTFMLDVAGQHERRRANLVAWARVFWGQVQKMLQHTIATIGHHSLTITVRITGTKSVYRVQDA